MFIWLKTTEEQGHREVMNVWGRPEDWLLLKYSSIYNTYLS